MSLQQIGFVGLLLSALSTATAEVNDTHQWSIGVELGLAQPSTLLDSWADGGIGKLRYGMGDRGLVASRGYGEYRGRISPTLIAHLTADVVAGASSGFDITEAYLERRPIPRSANRQRWRFGLFHAPWSLENSGPGWTTPLTLSPSTVNTWIGEELRPLGVEWTLERRIAAVGSEHRLGAHAAAFFGNDPAGSLLAWRGWSLHDRESRFHDELPIAALPQLRPGALFELQAPYVEPWREVDQRAGYYVGVDWRYAQRFLVTLAHYDNRADPLQINSGQYAWHTRFEQLGTQVELPAGIGLLAQWMMGTTAMGPLLGTAHAVDTDFEARYVLVTKLIAKQRVSIRYDDFRVVDNDLVPNDDNSDSGHAWTIAYRYNHSARWSLGAEWLSVASWHPAWQYFGAAAHETEQLVQLRFGIHLGAPTRLY